MLIVTIGQNGSKYYKCVILDPSTDIALFAWHNDGKVMGPHKIHEAEDSTALRGE